MFRKPEKELVISSNQTSGNYKNINKQQIVQTVQPSNSDKKTAPNSSPTMENNVSAQLKQSPVNTNRTEFVRQPESRPTKPEAAVYFCGAQTKKGAPCTRRVKNGGRCWQHTGQTAMLPQRKLPASQ